MASDALQDFTTLTGALGDFAQSVVTLFNVRVQSESDRLAVEVGNAQTDFLLGMSKRGDDGRYLINTTNYQEKLDEFNANVNSQFQTIADPAVRNRVQRSFSEGQNNFNLKVAQGLSAQAYKEIQENDLVTVQNIVGSNDSYAVKLKKLTDFYNIVKGRQDFSPADLYNNFQPSLDEIGAQSLIEKARIDGTDLRDYSHQLLTDEKLAPTGIRTRAAKIASDMADYSDAQAKEKFTNDYSQQILQGRTDDASIKIMKDNLSKMGASKELINSLDPKINTLKASFFGGQMKSIVAQTEAMFPYGLDEDNFKKYSNMITDIREKSGMKDDPSINDSYMDCESKLNAMRLAASGSDARLKAQNLEAFNIAFSEWMMKAKTGQPGGTEADLLSMCFNNRKVGKSFESGWLFMPGCAAAVRTVVENCNSGAYGFKPSETDRAISSMMTDPATMSRVNAAAASLAKTMGLKINSDVSAAVKKDQNKNPLNNIQALISNAYMGAVNKAVANNGGRPLSEADATKIMARVEFELSNAIKYHDFQFTPTANDKDEDTILKQMHSLVGMEDKGNVIDQYIMATDQTGTPFFADSFRNAYNGYAQAMNIVVKRILADPETKKQIEGVGDEGLNALRMKLYDGKYYLTTVGNRYWYNLDAVGEPGSGKYDLIKYDTETEKVTHIKMPNKPNKPKPERKDDSERVDNILKSPKADLRDDENKGDR